MRNILALVLHMQWPVSRRGYDRIAYSIPYEYFGIHKMKLIRGWTASTHTHIVTMNLQRNIIMFGLCSTIANWLANYYLLFLNVFITFARRITQSIANRFRFLFSGRQAFGTEFCTVGQNEYRKETIIIIISQCDILLPNRKETHIEINEFVESLNLNLH